MNNSNIEKIKKYALLFAFFIASGLLLWGSSYLVSGLKQDAYLQDAEYILKNSPLCSHYSNIKVVKPVAPSSLNMNFCNAVFEVRVGDKKGYAAFINMSGKYGMYQGLFLYSKSGGFDQSFFCGLCGQISDKPAMYYGITPLTINICAKKLDKAFRQAELNGKGEK
ncbi:MULTISPECIES: hypothetical protein [unclassified Treponema]|uniref:hypothetical protein n=1 Tax=unclassified Treponema TaxID=2638727 RepID=UPI0020A3C6F0|nr:MULTISPECIES: hypothetical protein [unclassified Treponema]UTC68256.1 hypothetical protein E4O06_06380 [Treponema sp. OMZ 789]UTC70976.1 hypothetical protein E4O01_06525 [Treponema sp. OMZ 790]UTC73716.1 hypothetical protein E4O02_06720 [Treponema sp. OMZ 791]